MKNNIQNYNIDELIQEMGKLGEKPYRAEQIFRWLYTERVESFEEMTNLSKSLREKLEDNFGINSFKIEQKLVSKDGTKKYLFNLCDVENNLIETVLMKYHHGYTICVSSQVGCKMGCEFCASTGIPFVRNLSAGEIVRQLIETEKDENIRISNIVFMGIGEPLDNFENVMKAIEIMNYPKGLNIGARHISISTSGIVPKIYELADRKMQCTLSVSLHSSSNTKRSKMMPVNKKYPIEELMKACNYYIEKTNKRISFEYALVKEDNDKIEDAENLVKLLKGMLVHVNLIQINEIGNTDYLKSSDKNILKFRDYLNEHGIVATIRRELGSDINAACGMLRRRKSI